MGTKRFAEAGAAARGRGDERRLLLWLLLAALSGVALWAWAHDGVRPRPALTVEHESGALRLLREIGPAPCSHCAPAEPSSGSPASAVAPSAPEPLVIARSLGHRHSRPRDDRAPAGQAVAPLDPPPNA